MKQASRQAVPRALLRIGIVGLILAAGAGAGSLAYATIAAGPATAYVGMFGAACGTETEVQLPMPANGTVQELHATLSVAPGSGNSVTFTIRKNGSSTSVTCTISGTATSCGDSSNAIGFATGDLISMQFVE